MALSEAKANAFDFFRGVSRLPGGDAAFAGEEGAFEGVAEDRAFSTFDHENMLIVRDVVAEFIELYANADDEESGLQKVLERAVDVAAQHSLALSQHSLGIFVAHAAKLVDKETPFAVPPLAFKVSQDGGETAFDLSDEEEEEAEQLAGEDLLHFWREDLFLNEHHLHWHIVYPTSGIRIPGQAIRTKARQGEIFTYMHQQMLARYDTERVSVGLDPVEPLTNLQENLGVGYDPNARDPKAIGYNPRPANSTIAAGAANFLEAARGNVQSVISSSTLLNTPMTVDSDLVGALLESSSHVLTLGLPENLEGQFNRSFHLHNNGHGVLASTPVRNASVMASPHTSLQDPVFWRWHRMIDDVARDHAVSKDPHSFDDQGLVVSSEGPIVISEQVLKDKGIDLNSAGRSDDLQSLLADNFDDLSAEVGEVILKTGLYKERFEYDRMIVDPNTGRPIPIRDPATGLPTQEFRTVRLAFDRRHLFGERFAVAAKVKNTNSDVAAATLRIFICADEFLADDDADVEKIDQEHRFWIEMERAPIMLSPGQNIIARFIDESSVVRKLNGIAPHPTSSTTLQAFETVASSRGRERDYCDCGWPLSLMLPKGTEAGMSFQCMVMVSPGQPTTGLGTCGSRAFCGSDFDDYPEQSDINLGYPFDRPTQMRSSAMIAENLNMGMCAFTIKHDITFRPEFPSV